MPVALPLTLTELLAGSRSLQAGTLRFVDSCEVILESNEMPFFPAYTDHGLAHVQSLLEAADRLMTTEAQELLEPEDAAVLIGAGFLHDLSLHLREAGFLDLVTDPSPLAPLPWFREERPNRPADRPWSELWQQFRREARRFSQSQLDRLFGPRNAEVPPIAVEDTDREPASWTANDKLLVGEFIRRHHARLSHEIAIYGFPGADHEFPRLAETMPGIADAIGVAARSHNEDLRTMARYLEEAQPGDKRPDGAVLVYLMGVLRIADYFQIERGRAPTLLLHLKDPPSPQSVVEWNKHHAVQRVSWENEDPLAVNIQVSPDHELRTHLQLSELVEGLQSELDVTSAVLGETYGRSKLAGLQLSKQRVRTNLFARTLHDRLGFVPKRAQLRSADDLFRLVISDLYGNEPVVAGRELLQNAVDSVRELAAHAERTEFDQAAIDFRDIPADVLVEVRELDECRSELRVADRGIGMTPAVVIESFLTAGASFGPAQEDNEAVDPTTRIRRMKAGRFGVGVFAAFLLGSEVRVTTRHVESRRGVKFVARLDDDLVQLDWVDDVPAGTEIVVPFATSTVANHHPLRRAPVYGADFLDEIANYYRLPNPTAAFRWVGHEGRTRTSVTPENGPRPSCDVWGWWRAVRAADFDAVLWRIPSEKEWQSPWGSGQVVHNGIAIRKPFHSNAANTYQWSREMASTSLRIPDVAVFDSGRKLGVTLNRYELAERVLPFEDELLTSIGIDIVAHALASEGPVRHPLGIGWSLQPIASRDHWLPLHPELVDRYVDNDLCVLWTGPETERDAELQAIAARFLTDQSLFDLWPELGFRAALVVRHANSQSPEYENYRLTQKEVMDSTRMLGSHLQRKVVACVHVRQDDRLGQVVNSIDADEIETCPDDGAPLPPGLPNAGNLRNALRATGLELLKGSGSRALALTVLRNTRSQLFHGDPLAACWISALGGPLERDPRATRERRETLVRDNNDLGAFVMSWEERPLQRSAT